MLYPSRPLGGTQESVPVLSADAEQDGIMQPEEEQPGSASGISLSHRGLRDAVN